MTAPPPPRERRLAATELIRQGRPAAALALAADPPLPTVELALLAEVLLREQGFAEAVALLGPRVQAGPSPALVGPFVAAGLHLFRRSINDGADTALLRAMAEALMACPWAVIPPDRAELLRLLESQGMGALIPAIAARYTPVEVAGLLGVAATAEALSTRALLLGAGGRHHRARAAIEAAWRLAPAEPVLALHAGFAALADTDLATAQAGFDAARPMGEAAMERVPWPRLGGLPWPFAPPPADWEARFAALLPPGAAWPRISIVTPSLNQGDTLEQTILSVVHQGYPNLQYIVLDPGSRDASRAIIARQAARIDIAVLAPDRGQVDALNKGFAQADGALLGWLNADDMLGPGALFALALAWLATPGAEIVHGSCLAAREGGFVGLQMPLAEGQGLAAEGLADLHGAWLRGHYFLQPETLFTRGLFDRVGGLDPGLNFVPDYALWAQAVGARVAGTRWPAAIYRLHAAQKTAARRPMLLEQIAVRDALVPLPPAPWPVARLRRALAGATCRVRLVAHHRLRHDFEPAEIAAAAAALAPAITLDTGGAPAEADIMLRITRAHDGPDWVAPWRAEGFAGLAIAWLFEDMADPIAHAEMAPAFDLLLPRHAEAVPLLRHAEVPVLVPPREAGLAAGIMDLLAQLRAALARLDPVGA